MSDDTQASGRTKDSLAGQDIELGDLDLSEIDFDDPPRSAPSARDGERKTRKESRKKDDAKPVSGGDSAPKASGKGEVQAPAGSGANDTPTVSKPSTPVEDVASDAEEEDEEYHEVSSGPVLLTWSRGVFWVLVLALIAIQHRLWVGEGSFAEVWRLKLEIEKQEQENQVLAERNRRLAAEVRDLRDGQAAVEERARKQLGMVKEDETLYIINEDKKPFDAASH